MQIKSCFSQFPHFLICYNDNPPCLILCNTGRFLNHCSSFIHKAHFMLIMMHQEWCNFMLNIRKKTYNTSTKLLHCIYNLSLEILK